jgi:hypothetical protein
MEREQRTGLIQSWQRVTMGDGRRLVTIVSAIGLGVLLLGWCLASRPVDLQQRLGDVLPGWPWW